VPQIVLRVNILALFFDFFIFSPNKKYEFQRSQKQWMPLAKSQWHPLF